jgi:hypothetical protein
MCILLIQFVLKLKVSLRLMLTTCTEIKEQALVWFRSVKMGSIGTKGILFPYNKYFDVRNFLKNWCRLSQQWRCCLWSSGCNDVCNFVGGSQHFWGNSYETTWPHYPEDHSLWSDVGYVTVQIVSGTWEVTYIADRLLWLTNWIAYMLEHQILFQN